MPLFAHFEHLLSFLPFARIFRFANRASGIAQFFCLSCSRYFCHFVVLPILPYRRFIIIPGFTQLMLSLYRQERIWICWHAMKHVCKSLKIFPFKMGFSPQLEWKSIVIELPSVFLLFVSLYSGIFSFKSEQLKLARWILAYLIWAWEPLNFIGWLLQYIV